ncbi:hypothetical protein MMYC01_207456 [Madurella mycetomatis]|uniref:Vegetative incompatibility protein HET-E-1 n=1 Tax=Madurella mycetomatis TaxID=100816 RepID=A0A175VX67_9PEZI|nr:hypothetical protein MMYC01_207456 [Madurella mycetomatis]
MADGMRRSLRGEISELHSELFNRLWAPDWQLDDSIRDRSVLSAMSKDDIRSTAATVSRSLRFEAFEAREAAITESILQTYSWIYDRDPKTSEGSFSWSSFPEWLGKSSEPVYWITGKPGAGKSTLMKYILGNPAHRAYLERWSGDKPLLIVKYYAWNAGTNPQKSFQGLKKTLLVQALNHFPELLPILAPRRWTYALVIQGTSYLPPWEDWEVQESFQALLSHSNAEKLNLAIFIDGLDEFDAPPKEVVGLVESIVSSSSGGIKVCAASRPLVDFDDAYRDSPKVQMDLFTLRDMTVYLDEKLRQCRAFDELQCLYPDDVLKLREEMVKRAKGVFIWLKVVVDALTEAAREGEGIFELQAILESLPEDIRSLYDSIWAGIPEASRKKGAILLAIIEATQVRIIPSIFWLADDYAFRKYDIRSANQSHVDRNSSFYTSMVQSLRRKLASRTRGLLEINLRNDNVDYSHRTVREWTAQPEVRECIRELCGEIFDPHLYLLHMYTISFTSRTLMGSRDGTTITPAITIEPLLQASKFSADQPEATDELVRTLEALDMRAGLVLGADWPSRLTYGLSNMSESRCSFLVLTALFAIPQYIKAKVSADPRILSRRSTAGSSRNDTNLDILEAALYPTRFFSGSNIISSFTIPTSNKFGPQRLAVIRFLLKSASLPDKRARVSVLRSKIRVKELNTFDREESIYYSEVIKLLGRSRGGPLESASKFFRVR